MLHLIPRPLHRALYRVAHRARVLWYRLARPRSEGVCVVATDPEGRVLLVRHSYGSRKWSLPGGGMGRGEDPVACGLREFREELGCGLDDARLAASFMDTLYGVPHSGHVIAARVAGIPRADGRELTEAEWFDPDRLPAEINSRVARRIAMARGEG